MMRFLLGLTLGLAIGGLLALLATGDSGRALREQLRDRAAERGAADA